MPAAECAPTVACRAVRPDNLGVRLCLCRHATTRQGARRMISVVKVGASLYDLPDLGPRLRRFLHTLDGRIVLVPGGGASADVVRAWDQHHRLGEERAHWLALQALTLNAHFLADLLSIRVVDDSRERHEGPVVLDVYAFARADELRAGALPHTWEVTSDSIAARRTGVTGAARFYLLKSVTLPAAVSWREVARLGLVDKHFPSALADAGRLDVAFVNLRALSATCEAAASVSRTPNPGP